MKSIIVKISVIPIVVIILTGAFFLSDPEGFENYLINNDSRINLDIEGRLHRQAAEFDHFAEGLDRNDRSFLAKKARLLHLIRINNSELAMEISQFGTAMVDAATDKTLDSQELAMLKEINSDIVSIDDVDIWYYLVHQLKESAGDEADSKIILITDN